MTLPLLLYILPARVNHQFMKKKPTPKKLILIITIGSAFILIVLYCLLFTFSIELKSVALSSMGWGGEIPFIVLHDIQNQGNRGVLFVRLTDGKEHFIEGNWNSLVTSQNVYLFQGSEGYFIGKDQKITHFNFPASAGTIRSLQESSDHRQLLIETRINDGTKYCVIQNLDATVKNFECQKSLNVDHGDARAIWNPSQPDQIIVKNTKNDIYSWDKSQQLPQFVDPQKETDIRSQLENILNLPKPTQPEFFAFLNIGFIKKDTVWKNYRMPPFTKSAWMINNRYLILEEPGKIWIADLEKNILTELYKNPAVTGKNDLSVQP